MKKGKSVMKKVVSLILSFMMVTALMMVLPQTGVPVQAAPDVKDVNLGTEGIGNPTQPTNSTTPWKGSKVYFGTDPEPAKNLWMVLDPGTGLLFANGSVAERQFDNDSNDWDASDLKNWLNGNEYKVAKFSAPERDAISGEITLLTKDDVTKQIYGFFWSLHGSQSRKINVMWWLRSSCVESNHAAFVYDQGAVGYNGEHVDLEYGVRPAFNLNLSSVLFTSAAAGGKSATVGSTLTPVTMYGGDEWKLTLKDTKRNGFDASFSAKTETKLFIEYTGAQTGSNEYISAVVEDGGEITRYAKLKAVDGSANGSAEIDLISIPASGTLKVFNEQDNGEKKTDYASDLKQVTIPANVDAYDLSANLTGLMSNGTPYAKMSADYSATLTPDTGYTLPANITVKVNGTELTAGTDTYSYDQATGNLKIKAGKINGKIEIIAAGVGAGGGTVSATDNPQIERPDLWREFIKATLHKIGAAKEGETITIDFGGFNALTLSVMKQMAMRRDLTIKMVYYYKGTQYNLTFPAGMPINYSEDIPYYGPLKLADMAFRDGGVCTIR